MTEPQVFLIHPDVYAAIRRVMRKMDEPQKLQEPVYRTVSAWRAMNAHPRSARKGRGR